MDENEQLYTPITPPLPVPEPEFEEEEETYTPPQQSIPEHTTPEQDFEEELDTDINDLFEVPDSIAKVDANRDIKDADDDGSFDSLTTVTEEDIMGEEDIDEDIFPGGNHNDLPESRRRYRRTTKRYIPPHSPYTSLGGIRD